MSDKHGTRISPKQGEGEGPAITSLTASGARNLSIVGPNEKAPPRYLQETESEQFSAFRSRVKSSAFLHSLIVVLFLLVSWLIPDREPINLVPSLRVDLVALPDFTKAELENAVPSEKNEPEKGDGDETEPAKPKEQEPPKPDPKLAEKAAAEKAAAKEAEDMALEKIKRAQQDRTKERKQDIKNALDRIKALSELERDTEKTGKRRRVVSKGNEVSEGDSLSGAINQGAVNAWALKARDRIKENWNLPLWLLRQDLKARVKVLFDRNGSVTATFIQQGSGNAQFDEGALKAIRAAEPFGTPPGVVVAEGLVFAFPL